MHPVVPAVHQTAPSTGKMDRTAAAPPDSGERARYAAGLRDSERFAIRAAGLPRVHREDRLSRDLSGGRAAPACGQCPQPAGGRAARQHGQAYERSDLHDTACLYIWPRRREAYEVAQAHSATRYAGVLRGSPRWPSVNGKIRAMDRTTEAPAQFLLETGASNPRVSASPAAGHNEDAGGQGATFTKAPPPPRNFAHPWNSEPEHLARRLASTEACMLTVGSRSDMTKTESLPRRMLGTR